MRRYDVTILPLGGPPVLMLDVLQGPDRGMKYALPVGEPQLIGRSSEALPLTDTTVSRRHAELTPDDGRWFLRDLDSSNGTFVNGERISADRVELSPGDQIRCGSTLMVFAVASDEDRPSRVQILGPQDMDVTVERRLNANEDSMILAEPDPVKAATDHLRVIYELTALTASAIDRNALLERAMDLIFDEFRPDRGFILLRSDPTDPGGRLEPVVVRYRERPKTLDKDRIPVSQTIIQHTLSQGEGILSTNAMTDTRFRAGDSVQEYGIRSAICVPIQAGERIYGVLSVDSSLAQFTFTESQLRLLNAIGQHTGLALSSAELVSSMMQTERLAAIGQTVAWLSHSIKNILQGLRGGADAVELALNRGDLKLAKEGWPILTRNLDRIYGLTLNMLAFSKRRRLEPELIPLRRVVEEAAQLIQGQCDRKRVGLLLDLADDVPPIPLDPNALHQALMNLLTNALEAVPRKKGVITVRTRYLPDSQEAQITVSDNGPGIAPDRHDEIFEAFWSTKGQRGTGLGLAVTRKIAQEHGGGITLQSDPDQGATFIITLPSDRSALESADTRLPRAMPQPDLDLEF
jgi:signal transduction histidine kinase/pSer/pThr/pTyr-binding forkhead associated (FHA) protein